MYFLNARKIRASAVSRSYLLGPCVGVGAVTPLTGPLGTDDATQPLDICITMALSSNQKLVAGALAGLKLTIFHCMATFTAKGALVALIMQRCLLIAWPRHEAKVALPLSVETKEYVSPRLVVLACGLASTPPTIVINSHQLGSAAVVAEAALPPSHRASAEKSTLISTAELAGTNTVVCAPGRSVKMVEPANVVESVLTDVLVMTRLKKVVPLVIVSIVACVTVEVQTNPMPKAIVPAARRVKDTVFIISSRNDLVELNKS